MKKVDLLQILFIGLKLSNIINWSWWYVMLPYEIVYGFIIFCIVLVIAYLGLTFCSRQLK